jgi:hypothetical protein
MMFDQNRQSLRQFYSDSWKKFQQHENLSPLETQISNVIAEHPEYHSYIETPDKFNDQDFGEKNPFLHLSLHLGLREQLNTHRPTSIIDIFAALSKKYSPHDAEHLMMEVLGEMLFEAQRNKKYPDEIIYLEKLRKLV